tara:strand:- start:119 stop:430 length:312 start_codon:yes stop_codon:yes gene_type:complete
VGEFHLQQKVVVELHNLEVLHQKLQNLGDLGVEDLEVVVQELKVALHKQMHLVFQVLVLVILEEQVLQKHLVVVEVLVELEAMHRDQDHLVVHKVELVVHIKM